MIGDALNIVGGAGGVASRRGVLLFFTDDFASCLGGVGTVSASADSATGCVRGSKGGSSSSEASHAGKRERPRAARNGDANSDRTATFPMSMTRH